MCSLFSNQKKININIEEQKVENESEISKSMGLEFIQNDSNFIRISKAEIEKQILMKRRGESLNSLENLHTNYKKRLTSNN